MKVVFEPGDEITLRRVDECTDVDDWGLTQEEYDALLAYQRAGTIFEVVCEATDDYYDIQSTCDEGVVFGAVSAYHFEIVGATMLLLDL